LESESELLRLVGAQVQLASGSEDTTGAMEVLQGLLDESEESLVVGSVATMLTTFEILEEERITSITKSVLERAEDCSELEASAQIALHEARSYFAPTQGDATASIEALRELLTTKDHDTEARAALALARIGQADEVLARLN